MAEYTQIDAEAFGSAMKEWGFEERPPESGERIWDHSHKTAGCFIRIYSSIPAHGGEARDVGRDAIRVVGLWQPTGEGQAPRPVLPKQIRVHRVKGWRNNLQERARDVWRQLSRIPVCPACGAPTVERTRKSDGAAFRGCIRYPDCRGVK